MTMNIFIEGSPKEIAALALELQGRRGEAVTIDEGTVSEALLKSMRDRMPEAQGQS